MADIETLRLEREEKRRQRRERIRRILEDDDTPTTRRTRDGGGAESPRSSATSRRPRDEGVAPSSERTRSRQEPEKATERSTRTTRNTRETTKTSTTDTTDDTSSKMKARRDARRKRNQEHDLKQNKLTLENGEAHKLEKSSARDHSRTEEDSSGVKERLAARRRDKTEDSSRGDNMLSATDRLAEDTAQKTHGHEADEESKDNGTSDPKIKNTSSKKADRLHVDDFLEKVDENKKEDTGVNDSEKAQDENKPSVIETEISAKIEDISESVIEKEEDEQVEKLDVKKEDEEVKELNGTKEVQDVVGKGVEKKDEEVEKVDVEKSKKGIKVEEKMSSSDGRKERRRKEKQTEIETVNIRKVDGEKKEEVEEETNDQSKLEKLAELDQPVASEILGTIKVDIDLDNDGSSKDNEAFETTEVDGETREDNTDKMVEEAVRNDDDISDVSNSQLLGDAKQYSIKEDEMTINISTDAADHSTPEDGISEVDGWSSIGGIQKEDSGEPKDSNSQEDKESSTQEHEESSTQEHKESSTHENKEIATQENEESRTQESKESNTQERKESNTQEHEESSTQEHKESNTQEHKESSTQEHKDSSMQEHEESSTQEPKESSAQELKTSSTQEPKKPITKSNKSSRIGKLNVGDDSWKKNVRKKRGVPDKDRAVELTVLGRTGRIKNKMKSCATRDTENADPMKKEVKKGIRKHKSMDEETEKELKDLSRKRELKSRVEECDEKDKESADAWKREVKKNVRKHKSLDEDTENELKELSKTRLLKSRVKECNAKDKEAKLGTPSKISEEAEVGEDLKEFSGSGKLKNLIASCAERDDKRDEAWKSAKEKKKLKSADEEAELKELSNLSELKTKIIKTYEEKDKESADDSKKRIKSGEGTKSFDETTDEELKELSQTVSVKTRIQSTIEQQEKPKEAPKRADPTEDEELKEINLKSRPETYKQESERLGVEGKKRDTTETVETHEDTRGSKGTAVEEESSVDKGLAERSLTNEASKGVNKTSGTKRDTRGRRSPTKDDAHRGRISPTRQDTSGRVSPTKDSAVHGKTSPTRRDTSGRVSPTKDSAVHGRTSPTRRDTSGRVSPTKDSAVHGRTSPTRRDTSGRISPTKDSAVHGRTSPTKRDTSGRVSPTKDKAGRISPTKRDTSGRVSPTKDSEVHGRTSPTKRDTSGRVSPTKDSEVHGRTSPTKRDTSGRRSPAKDDRGGTPATKRDTKGKFTPIKDDSQPKSKLASIRSNLYESPKNKTKGKRESLDRVAKTVSIKDKIAACKERDKTSPQRVPVEKTPSKAKAKTVPDSNALTTGTAGESGENEVGDRVPVNHMGDQFMTIEQETKDASIKDALSFWKKPGDDKKASGEPEAQVDQDEEVVEVDIKGKMSYWESPKHADDGALSDEGAAKESEKPPTVVLGNVKQGWQKKNRKLNAAEFIKDLLNAKCKRRDLNDIQDVKSGTKKYLVAKKGEEKVRGSSVTDYDTEPKPVKKKVDEENKKKSKEAPVETRRKNIYEDFSFDDVVNPNEVKQLKDFSDFRRQVRPANRRAAKSNPVRKLQQREDLKTEADFFDDVEDEEDSAPKPTAIGRLGRLIGPGDRKSKDINTFALDALAGLSAKEDVSKITLKKTAKSGAGVSQEKTAHDGTAPVMLLQIKGHRHMQTRLVEPSVESLNSGDAFLLVTDKYLHVWLGKEANVMKKSKASELSNKILQYKLLNCKAPTITIIKDGDVDVETALTRTFWKLLGGKKPVKSGKNVPKDGDYEKAVVSTNAIFTVDTSSEPAKLERLPELSGKIPSIKMLDSDEAFVFDFGTEVYAWLGRTCDKSTRGKAVELAQEVFKDTFKVKNPLNPIHPNTLSEEREKSEELKRPSWAVFGRMTERAETILFEQKFLDWPDAVLKEKLDKQKDLLNKNLSSGYAKRKAKMEPVEVQFIELVSYDGAKMAEEPPPVKMILEGVNVGRGRGSYDEIERRTLEITTNSVTVYHSSDKEYRQLEEKEWGHFYSAESYVIRWSYSVKTSGIRSLKGGESKRETTGRDQIAYFFWHGRDCSASGKGTSALATIELDSDKSPQIMVDEGNESACFLNMFDGQMVVHHGKPDEAKSIEDDNVFMYCVHHEEEKEVSLTQIEARSSNLRSRSSFIIVVIGKSIGICVWQGSKSTKEKKEGALRGAKRLAVWFKDMFDIKELDIVELEEGNEGSLFWEALDGKNYYGSLIQSGHKCDNRVRLFNFTSTEGPFIAKEIPNPTRGELVSPYPFRQSELYDASQPALFLVDTVYEMYLWQGWWPVNPEESDSVTTTGSAEFRWHRDRRLAMQTIQSYADVVGRQMSKSYVVNAGLEPAEFRAFLPFWEDHPDVARLNLESGKVDGKKASLPDLLAKLSRDRYTLAELRVRPLPEGVDPSKMEMYLSDEEFKEVFSISKDEFTKLPKWKKLEQRKQAGLF